MRVFFFFFHFFIIAGNLCAQKNKSQKEEADVYYAFNIDWKAVSDPDSAVYFSRFRKVSDTCWEVHNYNIIGPMISKEVYKDEENKIAHGRWLFYRHNGYVDSICAFENNLAHGDWYYYKMVNDTNRAYKRKVFEKGRFKYEVDLLKEDSIRKAKETASPKKDEEESYFPGGGKGWKRYLEKNLVYPERAIKSKREGMAIVAFMVDEEGNVGMVDLFKSADVSMDDEALRLILKSPKWKPGIREGKKIKTYKLQPIIFKISETIESSVF